MRLRQWVVSLSFFLISVIFLLFSKTLFQTRAGQVPDTLSALPTTECHALLLPNKDYYPYLKAYFQKAQKSIIGTVYLVKTAGFPDNEPMDLLRELVSASKRNVQVDIVLERSEDPGEMQDSNLVASEMLQKAGVHVHYDPANRTTHAKTFVIDDRYCFIGSHNLTHAAMTRNEELSVFIDSAEMAQQVTDFVHQIPTSK